MLLAEINAEGWVIIIGSATVGLTTLVTSVVNLILGYMRENRNIERAKSQDATLTTIVSELEHGKPAAQAGANKEHGKEPNP